MDRVCWQACSLPDPCLLKASHPATPSLAPRDLLCAQGESPPMTALGRPKYVWRCDTAAPEGQLALNGRCRRCERECQSAAPLRPLDASFAFATLLRSFRAGTLFVYSAIAPFLFGRSPSSPVHTRFAHPPPSSSLITSQDVPLPHVGRPTRPHCTLLRPEPSCAIAVPWLAALSPAPSVRPACAMNRRGCTS